MPKVLRYEACRLNAVILLWTTWKETVTGFLTQHGEKMDGILTTVIQQLPSRILNMMEENIEKP